MKIKATLVNREIINDVQFKLVDVIIWFKNKCVEIQYEAMIVRPDCFSISGFSIKGDCEEGKNMEMMMYFAWRKEIIELMHNI